MPILLNRMPFTPHPGDVVVRGESVRIRTDQIIVWVSLSLRHVEEQNPAVMPFPAILDTGYSHSFAITERQLIEWSGVRPEAMAASSAVRERGQKLLLRQANIWVHANEPASRDRLADRPPHLVEAESGIAIYPTGDFPRLPLLGLRVIAENNLVLKVDGPRREATLRTPFKWWPFG